MLLCVASFPLKSLTPGCLSVKAVALYGFSDSPLFAKVVASRAVVVNASPAFKLSRMVVGLRKSLNNQERIDLVTR